MPLIDSFYLFIVCVVFVAFQGVHRLDRTGIGSTSICVEGVGHWLVDMCRSLVGV